MTFPSPQLRTNVYVDPRGWKHCRTCRSKYRKAHSERKRPAKHASRGKPFVTGDPRINLSGKSRRTEKSRIQQLTAKAANSDSVTTSANELSLVTHQDVLLRAASQVSGTVLPDTRLAKPPCVPGDGLSEPQTHASVKAEAAALFAMMHRSHESRESVRELISIDPGQVDALMEFATARPGEAYWVLAAIRYRELVLQEFDRLGSGGLGEAG